VHARLKDRTSLIAVSRDFPTGKFLDSTVTGIALITVALVRKRTIPKERPPLAGEVSANFCG
jgi:hypothetical protein